MCLTVEVGVSVCLCVCGGVGGPLGLAQRLYEGLRGRADSEEWSPHAL